MKLTVITTVILLAASGYALASPASEEAVAAAKTTLGEALYKSALLTGAMPDDTTNPIEAGKAMGAEMSQRLDNVVIGGLNQGADCEDITANVQKSFEIMQRGAVNQFASSSAIKKALDNVPLSAAQYASAQCHNLTTQ
ncbi:hypothetical protein KXR87_12615 [Yokenella regensburgei]|uniref:hypothetical protein n=1 Tax=Yokenella regensburgei TaxID=158877 RepID=UPI003F190A43